MHKAKRFDTDDFEIVAVKEATKKDAGTPVFECKAGNHTFFARPTGTMDERREMWKDRDRYVGRKMTVKYRGLTKDDIPRFPVAIGVRDYE